ncbi:histone deacetylase family protein [Fervidobacterium thailandense]|uniref:Histone deacetylase n=1 Tax=Fervidobacterium thailandense TaxID=1008305 RepID=A0A1E3G201_9BACT|nr:histone deacetylase family protein [Fervidobacterium thailandense]ODN30285.1 histone deacetylase [Fervidobacterium thailandense]
MKTKTQEIVVFAELNLNFRPTKEIDNGRFIRNPERPSRLRFILEFLEKHFPIGQVRSFPEEVLSLAHSVEYIDYLKTKCAQVESEYIPEVFFLDKVFDTGTPILRQTFDAAKKAVDATLSAVEYTLVTNRMTYALTRPPGHHAMKSYAGGYCYFNNVAIAGRYLESRGMRVAILDLDFHHGNGTQEIFYEDPNVLFVSIHGTPKEFYPWFSGFENEVGAGQAVGLNVNIPLPRGTNGSSYLEALRTAIGKIEDFRPDYVLISLGTDTHIEDPVGKFSLIDRDYVSIGAELSKLRERVSFLTFVHEGGYNPRANARAVKNLLQGFLGIFSMEG